MNKIEMAVFFTGFILVMIGLTTLANKLGETENRLNYICGEVHELNMLEIDQLGVCATIEE